VRGVEWTIVCTSKDGIDTIMDAGIETSDIGEELQELVEEREEEYNYMIRPTIDKDYDDLDDEEEEEEDGDEGEEEEEEEE
jgi:hypothetical protein